MLITTSVAVMPVHRDLHNPDRHCSEQERIEFGIGPHTMSLWHNVCTDGDLLLNMDASLISDLLASKLQVELDG